MGAAHKTVRTAANAETPTELAAARHSSSSGSPAATPRTVQYTSTATGKPMETANTAPQYARAGQRQRPRGIGSGSRVAPPRLR